MNILDEAQKLTSHDRQDVYGHPSDTFAIISQMSQPIQDSNIDPRLKHALMMIQVKVARLLTTPLHEDSVVDIAGYANTYGMILDRIKEESNQIEEMPF